MSINKLIAYYAGLLDQAKANVDGKVILIVDVEGIQQAVDVLRSIQAGAMTPPEAVEYVNDPSFDNLPGIKWARKAAKQAQRKRR